VFSIAPSGRPHSIVRRAAVARSFQAFSAAFSSRGPVSMSARRPLNSPNLTLKNCVIQSGGTIRPAPSTTARTFHYSPRYSTHESLLFAEHHKYCRPKLSITIVCSSVKRASAVSYPPLLPTIHPGCRSPGPSCAGTAASSGPAAPAPTAAASGASPVAWSDRPSSPGAGSPRSTRSPPSVGATS